MTEEQFKLCHSATIEAAYSCNYIPAAIAHKEAASELQRLYESSQWQPISTAPDETEVLVWCDGTAQVMSRDGDRWWDFESHGWQPTHWRPLPEAPK